MIIVIEPGPQALIQDRGRPGLGHYGIARSGPVDRGGFALANRLVRNRPGSPAFELVLGGFVFEATVDLELALCGTDSELQVGDRRHGSNAPVRVGAGERLEVLRPEHGLRNYLAVRGGLEVEPVLGSCATDLMSGIGPAPVKTGDRLHIASSSPVGAAVDIAPAPIPTDHVEVVVATGPHRAWFGPEAIAVLETTTYTVGVDSDRVGTRLVGSSVPRTDRSELPSEPMVRGAIQIPSGGIPIVMMADFPVTGGYPVVGVVDECGVDRLAQARPGTPVRLMLESSDPR